MQIKNRWTGDVIFEAEAALPLGYCRNPETDAVEFVVYVPDAK